MTQTRLKDATHRVPALHTAPCAAPLTNSGHIMPSCGVNPDLRFAHHEEVALSCSLATAKLSRLLGSVQYLNVVDLGLHLHDRSLATRVKSVLGRMAPELRYSCSATKNCRGGVVALH